MATSQGLHSFLSTLRELALTMQMPFCSWHLPSFYSCVFLRFLYQLILFRKRLECLGYRNTKRLEQNKAWEYCAEAQVQPLSQKLLYLHLREVTLGVAEGEDFTGNGISKIFKIPFPPLNILAIRNLVFTFFCLVTFPTFKTLPTSTLPT